MKHITAIIIITAITLFLSQTAFGQTDLRQTPIGNPLFIELSVNLEALPESVTLEDAQISLNDAPITTDEIKAEGSIAIPVMPGKHTLKVLVPSHGADRIGFEAKPEATGNFALTLTPHLLGLSQHVDDYKLEWANSNGHLAPTTGQMSLKFTDKAGEIIPVTQLMDVRLSAQYSSEQEILMTDLFSIPEPGIIALDNKERFLQLFHNVEQDQRNIIITVSARDPISGLDYSKNTSVKLAPVAIKGRIFRGETVPKAISLEGISMNIKGQRLKTDAQGRFSVSGVPSGKVHISAQAYERKTRESGTKYNIGYTARKAFDLSGPAEVEITLERKKHGHKGVIKLLSHDPAPEITPDTNALTEPAELDIKPHVRFKLINLIANPESVKDWDEQKKIETYCRAAYKRGWSIQRGYCSNKIKKQWTKPIDISAGPEDEAFRLGRLHIARGHVWFVTRDDQFTASITPEYHLSDWGYGAYGYAVTVLDFKNDKVAIHLPTPDEIGWVDVETLLGKRGEDDFDSQTAMKPNHIGFTHLNSCGWSLAGEQIIVESTDENSFTYRKPTPHDLWSPYDGDTEQPPLGTHESITAPWEKAYSAGRKLILIPNPGKEC